MLMKKSRLRLYVLLSLLIHILLLWLLRFLPPSHPTPTPPPPVAIRMLDVPPAPTPLPQATPRPPQEERRQPPQERKPPQPQQGGVLAELPKPVQEERPDAARIVSQFDSKAQDIGPGESGVQKPSGEKPPQLPPELALPERYSTRRPAPPQTPPSQPKLQDPTPPAPSLQARQLPPTPRDAAKPRPLKSQKDPVLSPSGEQPTPKSAPQPEEPRFRITAEQEVAMLQRPYPEAEQARQQAMEEHFVRLEKNLPLPSFDAPGVYEQGPEQPGEGQENTGGGKYRSIDAYGLRHFSYLVGVKRKIELVFSVPYFQYRGTVGVPIVGFTIRRDGVLAEAVLLRSSGYAVVDRALLDAVKRAAPYGPFPEHLPDGEISIRVYATLS
jgi:protein TonB